MSAMLTFIYCCEVAAVLPDDLFNFHLCYPQKLENGRWLRFPASVDNTDRHHDLLLSLSGPNLVGEEVKCFITRPLASRGGAGV